MKKYQISLGEQKMIKDQGLLQFEEIKKQITVLPELEQLIPPLVGDELQQLEQNILKEGCREALLIWPTTRNVFDPVAENGQQKVYVLIDGHNRFGICQKHGLDFKIHLIDFQSMYDVQSYMIDNQLGRRNLTPEQTSYLRGIKYLTEKKERGKYDRIEHKGQNVLYGENAFETGTEKDTKKHKGQNVLYGEEVLTTSEKLGQKFNVSEKTIKRDADFAAGLDKLAGPLKTAILSGKAKVNKQHIQQIGKDDTVAMPIETIEQLEGWGKEQTDSTTKETPQELLIRQLAQLTKQLQQSYSAQTCDEIIVCVTKIKKIVAKKQK
jgi:hypothetical protein